MLGEFYQNSSRPLPLTGWQSRIPASTHALTYAQQIISSSLTHLSPLYLPMPPHLPPGTSRTSNFLPSIDLPQMVTRCSSTIASLPSIVLLLVVVGAFARFLLAYQRKRRTICATMAEKEETLPTEKPPTPEPSPESSPEAFRPVYPWIAPPQPLPGPYDPRLYPLPTIRRHSYPEPAQDESVETGRISYTRRVSANPTRQSTLNGVVMTGSNGTSGWRRNQWVVEGG